MEQKYIPVCKGSGLYHTPKIKYSKETQQYVQKLLNESKLSIIQRSNVENIIKNGDPLPSPSKTETKIKLISTATKPKSSKRRSQDQIIRSGAYEREKFISIQNKVPYDKEKSRLQSLMAYGKEKPSEDFKKQKMEEIEETEIVEPTKEEIFENLIVEIEEREQFLEEMEELGEDKKYKNIIENEIACKMKQLEMLDKKRFKEQTGAVEKYRGMFKILNDSKSLPLNGVYF